MAGIPQPPSHRHHPPHKGDGVAVLLFNLWQTCYGAKSNWYNQLDMRIHMEKEASQNGRNKKAPPESRRGSFYSLNEDYSSITPVCSLKGDLTFTFLRLIASMVCFCLDTVLFNLFFLFSLVTAMTFLIKAAKIIKFSVKQNFP